MTQRTAGTSQISEASGIAISNGKYTRSWAGRIMLAHWLTGEQRDLVLACSDLGQLDVWVDRALAATSADEVFKD